MKKMILTAILFISFVTPVLAEEDSAIYYQCVAKAVDLSPNMRVPLHNKGNMSLNLRTAIQNAFITTSYNYNYMCRTASNLKAKPLFEDQWFISDPNPADCSYECEETSL